MRGSQIPTRPWRKLESASIGCLGSGFRGFRGFGGFRDVPRHAGNGWRGMDLFWGSSVNKGPDTIAFQRRIFLVYFDGLKKYEEEMTEDWVCIDFPGINGNVDKFIPGAAGDGGANLGGKQGNWRAEGGGRHLGQVGGLRVSGRAWLVYRTTQEAIGDSEVHYKSTGLPNEGSLWNDFLLGNPMGLMPCT